MVGNMGEECASSKRRALTFEELLTEKPLLYCRLCDRFPKNTHNCVVKY